MPRVDKAQQERNAKLWGRIAATRGEHSDQCPYSLPHMRRAWRDGWRQGKKIKKVK